MRGGPELRSVSTNFPGKQLTGRYCLLTHMDLLTYMNLLTCMDLLSYMDTLTYIELLAYMDLQTYMDLLTYMDEHLLHKGFALKFIMTNIAQYLVSRPIWRFNEKPCLLCV